MNKKAQQYLLESLEGFRYCRKDAETSMKGSSAYSKLILFHLDSIIAGLENSQEGFDLYLRASMDVLREVIAKAIWSFFMQRAITHEKLSEYVSARAFESCYILAFLKFQLYQKFKDEPEEKEDTPQKTSEVRNYRKKPIIVQAIQWNDFNLDEVLKFAGTEATFKSRDTLLVETLEGVMQASIGDFIIKGIKGEFYPCKEDIFKKTYELIK